MAGRSGNGWATCALEHRHWGLFGAAGLLAYVPSPDSPASSLVLMQHRAGWSHEGGTWSLPGGAMDSEETPAETALREADEECGVNPKLVVPRGLFSDEHGGWVYHTVLAQAKDAFKVYADAYESDDAAWLPAGEVDQLELHPGFAAYWPLLRRALLPLTVIVDGASLLPGRPEAGPARRLRDSLTGLTLTGLAALPDGLGEPALARWYPDYVLVLDGDARAAAADPPAVPPDSGVPSWSAPLVVPTADVRAVAAAGSGTDEIADLAAATAGARLVVTGRAEVGDRAAAAGASVTTPQWLLRLL
ncbi:MAG TPA: NUDIX hydrolase [Streptosporangiaceae bacterium]|nr:NUDIX hydrolase [Streptosporangiaceae bacterium]